MRTLVVGMNVVNHDTAIFVADPERRDRFALATERLTRFKHDSLYPIAPLRRYIEHAGIDPRSVERLIVGDCYRTNRGRPAIVHTLRFLLLLREQFAEPYLEGYERALGSLLSRSHLGKLRSLLRTPSGRRFLATGLRALFTRSTLSKAEMLEWIMGILMIDRATAQKMMESASIPLGFRTVEEDMRANLRDVFPNAQVEWEYHDHHTCHAATAFMSSPFERSLVVTTDTEGDNFFTKVFSADARGIVELGGSRVALLDIVPGTAGMAALDVILGSLSGLYSQVTEALGFRKDCDEGKVEALAAYGNGDNPLYEALLAVVAFDEDKLEFSIDPIAGRELVRSLGRYVDLLGHEKVAAAAQRYLETRTLAYVSAALARLDHTNVCLAGGAAANVVVNMRIFESALARLHVAPAMGDDGAAEGAGLLSLLRHYPTEQTAWLKGVSVPYWGPSHSRAETRACLDARSDSLVIEDLGAEWPEAVAARVADGQIGAIFHGRMEWGPRALGNRSILADARRPDVRDVLNARVKRRPKFQPFCPSVLQEEMERLFVRAYPNKHMTCAFQMRPEFRSALPGAVHIDGTARVQFVEECDNPDYFRLLKELKRRIGFGVCINTSFNLHGRTIVESPGDAVTDFLDSGMDFLCINGFLCERRKSTR